MFLRTKKCFSVKKKYISTKAIANLTPLLPMDFFDEFTSVELKTDGSNERDAISIYRQIIKLLKKDKSPNVEKSIEFVKSSFKKNKELPTQDAVNVKTFLFFTFRLR
jgi:hypothetical protein